MFSILRRPKPRTVRSPKVEEHLEQIAVTALRQAQASFPLSYNPLIEWRRYSVTAGMAHYQKGIITLSAIVLKEPDQVRETLLHEYAHLLAFDRHGRKGAGHGIHWKTAMRDLGLDPKVHHQYEVKRNQSHQVVVYTCKKCGETFERKRRFQARKRYYHRQCGGQIALLEVQKATSSAKKA